jgi:hypothetical protein
MECITIQHGEIRNNRTLDDLLKSGIEELFVVDLDSIRSGAPNLKLYGSLSKYFELIVMNYPYRVSDLIDTFVSGASRVVISNDITDRLIREYLSVSDQLVMKYANNTACRVFSLLGGNMFLSNIEINMIYSTLYAYGVRIQSNTAITKRDSQKIIILDNFPAQEFQ